MASTRKQVVASELNWHKMQLTGALGHLRYLLKKYSWNPEGYEDELYTLEVGIRQGMAFKAKTEKISGDYTRNGDTVNERKKEEDHEAN